MREMENWPLVIWLAGKLGIRARARTPEAILEASRFGIRAAAKVPDPILDASRVGITEGENEPEVMSLALWVWPARAYSVCVWLMDASCANWPSICVLV